jgi:transcriptional regulator with XRE-family HTH domain
MMLRKLRLAAGLTNADAAKAAGMSSSVLSNVETAKSGIYLDNLVKLLDLYEASGSLRAWLIDIASHIEERGWLQMPGDTTLPEDWQTWIELEANAARAFNYETLLIPGLLQTPEYAKTIIRSTTSGLSDREVDKLTSSRIARQTLLDRTCPLRLHAIIEESALNRPVGGTDAWIRQLQHLISCATHPNIMIQIAPTGAGSHRGLNGPFVILDYGDNTKLVHLENKTINLFLDQEEEIAEYMQTWAELQEISHDAEKSIKLISVIIARAGQENRNNHEHDRYTHL